MCELVLAGSGLKLFHKAVTSLSKLGAEVLVEVRPEKGLELRTINTSCSAYGAIRLHVPCFDTFRVTQPEALQTGVYSKHLLAVLRTPKAESLTLHMLQDSCRLTLQLACPKSGLTKTYEVTCIAEPQFLCAQVDRRRLAARLVADAKGLGRLLSNFHSGQSDVTLVSLPEGLPAVRGPPAAQQQQHHASAPKRLRLVSHTDPAKAAAAPAGTPLTTRLALDVTEEVVQGYTHRGDAMAEACVNLKDLKVMVAFCESVDANIAIHFDSPGAPLVCSPDFKNRITHFFHGPERTMDFDAELVLATVLDHSPAVFEPHEAQLQATLAARRAETAAAAAPAAITAAPVPQSEFGFTDATQQQQQQQHGRVFQAAPLPAPVQPRISPLAGSAPEPAQRDGRGARPSGAPPAWAREPGGSPDPFAFTDDDMDTRLRRAGGPYN